MNNMRKVLGFLTAAMMLAAFAVPASGNFDDEKFSFVMAPASVSAGTQTITATITNLDFFDHIKSFKITVPAGVTITTPTSPTIPASKITVASGVVSVSGVLIKWKQSAVLTMSATFPATGCGSTPFNWNVQAFGGLFVSNEQFTLDPTKSNLTTTVSVTCTLSFLTQPNNALAGAIITNTPYNIPAGQFVKVQLLVGGSPAPSSFDRQVSLTSACTLSNSQVTSISGVATFGQLSSGAGASCKLTASAPGFAPATSSDFSVTVADKALTCPSITPTGSGQDTLTETSGANTTTLLRKENKDASVCAPTPVDVTFSDADRTVQVTFDQSQPATVIDTTTLWPFELIDPATGLPKVTRVAWEVIGGTPQYVPGPACLSSVPPAPYGTLGANITDTVTTSIMITAASLPTPPFAIVIASNVPLTDPERMLVTALSGSGTYTATVVRGTGGTTASTHSSGAAVVSTPLPIIDSNAKLPVGSSTPHPYAGKQAQVCIIEEIFSVQPFGTAGCPAQAPGVEPLGCVQVETHLFLLQDPYVSRN